MSGLNERFDAEKRYKELYGHSILMMVFFSIKRAYQNRHGS